MKSVTFLLSILLLAGCQKDTDSATSPSPSTPTQVNTFSVKNNGVSFLSDNLSSVLNNDTLLVKIPESASASQPLPRYLVKATLSSVTPGTYTYTGGSCQCGIDFAYETSAEIFTPQTGTVIVTENDASAHRLILSFELQLTGDSTGTPRSLTQGYMNCTY